MSSMDDFAPKPSTLRHPPGLYALFATELWERFSYYGMRALLVLYLTDAHFFAYPRELALEIYALYTGLVYLTPLLGGFLADRYLGQRKAIFAGGILMALGQFTLAMGMPYLNYGLGLIILGNGFFKPNISTMVGMLYPKDDPRRDGAFTIFYMGINVGAFLAPLICGYVAEDPAGDNNRWHYGFLTAGLGMVTSVIVFQAFQGLLQGTGLPPGRKPADHLRARDYLDIIGVVGACVGLLALVVFALPVLRPIWSPSFFNAIEEGPWRVAAQWVYRFALMGAVMAALWFSSRPKSEEPFTPEEVQRITLIFIVVTFSVVFWMGFEQAGGTMNLFAEEKTQRDLGSVVDPETGQARPWFTIPTTWFQSVNPFFIFMLAPIFSVLWTKLAMSDVKFSSVTKFGIGLLLLGSGFIVMYFAEQQAAVSGKAGPSWLILVYFLHTVGELFLSPIGLSLVNKLSPARIASLMMAVWFLSNFVANILAGILESVVGQAYLWPFLIAVACGSGVLLLAISPILKKMAHGRD